LNSTDCCSTAVFSSYLIYVSGLSFEEEPDYQYLNDIFTQAMRTSGESFDGVYDWMKLNDGQGWNSANVTQQIMPQPTAGTDSQISNTHHNKSTKQPLERRSSTISIVGHVSNHLANLDSGESRSPDSNFIVSDREEDPLVQETSITQIGAQPAALKEKVYESETKQAYPVEPKPFEVSMPVRQNEGSEMIIIQTPISDGKDIPKLDGTVSTSKRMHEDTMLFHKQREELLKNIDSFSNQCILLETQKRLLISENEEHVKSAAARERALNEQAKTDHQQILRFKAEIQKLQAEVEKTRDEGKTTSQELKRQFESNMEDYRKEVKQQERGYYLGSQRREQLLMEENDELVASLRAEAQEAKEECMRAWETIGKQQERIEVLESKLKKSQPLEKSISDDWELQPDDIPSDRY
jgi:hypothetical protein